MKYVYIATHDGGGRTLVVAATRKRMRKALRHHWDSQYPHAPLVFRKGDWQAYIQGEDGGFIPAPYTVEKHGVLR